MITTECETESFTAQLLFRFRFISGLWYYCLGFSRLITGLCGSLYTQVLSMQQRVGNGAISHLLTSVASIHF